MLFKPIQGDAPVAPTNYFIEINFMDKAIGAIEPPAILQSKPGAEEDPVFCRHIEPQIISYIPNNIASKMFNFAAILYNSGHNELSPKFTKLPV